MTSPGLRLGALLLVLGAWLGVTAAAWAGAVGSFANVARLADPERDPSPPGRKFRAARDASSDGHAAARYQAAEFNRWMFAAAGRSQLVLAGIALALAAWPGGPGRGVVSAVALAALLSAAATVVIVPWTSGLGRDLAFSADPPPPSLAEAVETMRGLHATYAALDVTKVALLLVAGALACCVRKSADSSRPSPPASSSDTARRKRARWTTGSDLAERSDSAGSAARSAASDDGDGRPR